MTKKYEFSEHEFQEKLKEQLLKHRRKKNLRQSDVANAVGASHSTYQRWESTGQHLTDIFTLLSVFQALDFSTAEIIDVLGLPPLTLNEIKAIYQDEDILKSIKGNGICFSMHEKCPDMEDFALESLLVLLLKERLKRLEDRQRNPHRTK